MQIENGPGDGVGLDIKAGKATTFNIIEKLRLSLLNAKFLQTAQLNRGELHLSVHTTEATIQSLTSQ